MGTRGLLIFKYKGIYYVIYNPYDSGVEGMGRYTATDIQVLCEQMNGNIARAKEYLGDLLDKVTFLVAGKKNNKNIEKMKETGHFQEILKFSSEGFLSALEEVPNALVECEEKPSTKPPVPGISIDYMWEIDVDAGTLGMAAAAIQIFVRWPWKSIYLQSINAFCDEAKLHVECFDEGYGYLINKTIYERKYKAIVIQAYVRRFLAMKRFLARRRVAAQPAKTVRAKKRRTK